MKTPEHIITMSSDLYTDCEKVAREMTIEYGIYVDVGREYQKGSGTYLSRIFFRAGGHEFDSIRDLRKALANKAFL